jgi:hypothetical protein
MLKKKHLQEVLRLREVIPVSALLTVAVISIVSSISSSSPRAAAQSPELQQKLAAVKGSLAANKQALSHYSWQEQETIAVKGDVKDTRMYQVHLGPDGKPQKVEMENLPQSSGPRGGPLMRHVEKKKKGEYQEYGEQVAALAHQYAQLDPERLQQAFQQGNVTFGPAGYEVKMVITSYVKPNDQVTLMFDQQAKAIESLHIKSYLDDPKDEVTISAQYSQLPDGTNHVATMQIYGKNKDLLVTTQNSEYQKMM